VKRILVFTDSLGLPRSVPEHCAYEDTWCFKLKRDFNVHQVSIGGATSSDILRQCPYHIEFKPDVVIVQIGIVDCAPRFLTKFELELIKKLPDKINSKLIRALNNSKVRNFRKITYVRTDLFARNIRKLQTFFKGTPVIFINILPASDSYEKILPGIKSRVEQYNEILINEAKYICETYDLHNKGVMSDYVHLNAFGHDMIYHKIFNFLTCIENSPRIH